PLALEALADPFETSLQLLPLQLELVPAIGGRALRGARLADLSLRGLERLRDVLQCLLPRARLLLGRGPLPEQPLDGFRALGAGAGELLSLRLERALLLVQGGQAGARALPGLPGGGEALVEPVQLALEARHVHGDARLLRAHRLPRLLHALEVGPRLRALRLEAGLLVEERGALLPRLPAALDRAGPGGPRALQLAGQLVAEPVHPPVLVGLGLQVCLRLAVRVLGVPPALPSALEVRLPRVEDLLGRGPGGRGAGLP